MAAGMPVAVVQNGTLPTQKEVVSTLTQVTAAVAAAQLQSPALVVVGEVVRYASIANVQTVIEEARKTA
jgi:uroporphyrin-III C-methyltransferase